MQKTNTHVLIIEPDKLLALAYRLALEGEGYGVSLAYASQEAIDQADAYSPDVILLELSLPRHDGVEFLYEFRSYAEWQAVPVVVITSLPPAQTARTAEALRTNLGVTDILYKPSASLKLILRAVREAKALQRESA